jgi:hypothetical protein
MVAWERDRSVPQGASMLLPMAWSPLFWLAVLLDARVGWSSTVTLLFVGLGSVTAGFPLFLLSENRPFAQQKARVGLGAFALLCVVALMDVGLPSWGLCVAGLLLWFLAARLVQQALATPRWRALVPVDAAGLGPAWRRAEGLSGRFTQQIGATRALLSLSSSVPLLDVLGPDAEHMRPADFGLDDPEEA